MLAVLLALAATPVPADPAAAIAALDPPPWTASAGERPLADSASFRTCDRLIATVSRQSDNPVANQRYALSRHWGRIMRAELVMPDRPQYVILRFTCWTVPGRARPQVFVEPPPEDMLPPAADHVTVDQITPPSPPPRRPPP